MVIIFSFVAILKKSLNKKYDYLGWNLSKI